MAQAGIVPLAAGEETEEESSGAASSANPYGKLVREEIAPGLDALRDEHGAWSPSRAWAAAGVLFVGCGVVFSLSPQI